MLYTIKHKIGTTAGGHLPYIQDLYQYAQEAFRISPEDHARLLAKATEEKVGQTMNLISFKIILTCSLFTVDSILYSKARTYPSKFVRSNFNPQRYYGLSIINFSDCCRLFEIIIKLCFRSFKFSQFDSYGRHVKLSTIKVRVKYSGLYSILFLVPCFLYQISCNESFSF